MQAVMRAPGASYISGICSYQSHDEGEGMGDTGKRPSQSAARETEQIGLDDFCYFELIALRTSVGHRVSDDSSFCTKSSLKLFPPP